MVPFSATTDRRQRSRHPGERVVGHRPALVEDEPGPHPAAYSSATAASAAVPDDLLVAAEGEPDVLRRLVAVGEQPLDCLTDRRDAALVVEGAAAPDRARVDLGRERRVLPGGRLVDRYDVEVRHQHDRPGRRRCPASGTGARGCRRG